MRNNRPQGPPPTEDVIDLTQSKAIDDLVNSLTEQLTITDAQARDYQIADRALTLHVHRSSELMHRVFEPLDVAEPESELQAA